MTRSTEGSSFAFYGSRPNGASGTTGPSAAASSGTSGNLRTPGRRRGPRGGRALGNGHDRQFSGPPLRLIPGRARDRLPLLGKLRSRSVAATNARGIQLIRRHRHLFKTITVDNGTEFHVYREIERATGTNFYFATPYHSWERGTNENTNGLVRQYIPKGRSMKHLTQARCSELAQRLNNRPRKRHRYFSPVELLALYTS